MSLGWASLGVAVSRQSLSNFSHNGLTAQAEVTYPAEESVTGGILSLCNNAGGLVLLVVLPSIPDSYNSLVMGLAVVLGTAVLIFVRVQYKRSDVDMERGTKELSEPFADKSVM